METLLLIPKPTEESTDDEVLQYMRKLEDYSSNTVKNCTRKVGSRNIGALGRTAGASCTLLIKHISRHLLRSADHFSDRQDTISGTHHRIC
jgi:hypothetical protein